MAKLKPYNNDANIQTMKMIDIGQTNNGSIIAIYKVTTMYMYK